jgi:phage host-nuclease inhibitor protein Gam
MSSTKNCKKVKDELENIEYEYPKQIKELKEQIQSAKLKTEEYEEKQKILADELRKLKAKKSNNNKTGAND